MYTYHIMAPFVAYHVHNFLHLNALVCSESIHPFSHEDHEVVLYISRTLWFHQTLQWEMSQLKVVFGKLWISMVHFPASRV